MLDPDALLWKIWRLDLLLGLVAHKIMTKGLEGMQLLKATMRWKCLLCYNWNPRPSSTFSLYKVVPIFTSHMLGTIGQSYTYFLLLPFTQHLMSSRQKPKFVLQWHIIGGGEFLLQTCHCPYVITHCSSLICYRLMFIANMFTAHYSPLIW